MQALQRHNFSDERFGFTRADALGKKTKSYTRAARAGLQTTAEELEGNRITPWAHVSRSESPLSLSKIDDKQMLVTAD